MSGRADVVVIGAGLSGLAAARRLRAAGAAVVVVERRRRAGGRVWTRRPWGDLAYEAGGEAIDRVNTSLLALARGAGMEVVESEAGWGDHAPARPLTEVAGRRVEGPPAIAGRLDAALLELGRTPSAAADGLTVADWLAAAGATPFERAYLAASMSVAASTVPLARMSMLALAVKNAARTGPGPGLELRFAEGAGRFAERLAAELGDRVRLGDGAVAVERAGAGAVVRLSSGARVQARRIVVAVPLPSRRGIAGLARAPVGSYGIAAKGLIELDGDLPPHAPAAALTDTALGYAYRHGPRTLVSFAGGRPAGRLARLAPAAADRELAGVVRRLFGAEVRRVDRVVWPRSYLILGPGELTGWWPRVRDRDGPVHYAGAETSELPSYMEGAVRAGERAAAEVVDALG